MKLFGYTVNINRRTVIGLTLLSVLAPAAYTAGRFWSPEQTGVTMLALGALLALPVGLVIGGAAATSTSSPAAPTNYRPALNQLRAELAENQQLLQARKGSTTLVARLAYVTAYWDAAASNGQFNGVFTPAALNNISLAYYWLRQASHLEQLAYDAKNSGLTQDAEFTTAKLISEVRLLDDPLERALVAALGAVADLS